MWESCCLSVLSTPRSFIEIRECLWFHKLLNVYTSRNLGIIWGKMYQEMWKILLRRDSGEFIQNSITLLSCQLLLKTGSLLKSEFHRAQISAQSPTDVPFSPLARVPLAALMETTCPHSLAPFLLALLGKPLERRQEKWQGLSVFTLVCFPFLQRWYLIRTMSWS